MKHSVMVLLLAAQAVAQSTATLKIDVVDGSNAVLNDAQITLSNALTGFVRTSAGPFSNIPFQTYLLTVSAPGFETVRREIDLRSAVPVELTVTLRVAATAASLEVRADAGDIALDRQATGSRAQINERALEQMPKPAGNRGLETVIASFPGFAQNANGAIHPRGAHNQMTYVVDGMPIFDQLTGAFAMSLDPSTIQSLELFTGNIPPEYGNKTAAVASLTTRTGLGSGRRAAGAVQATAAGYDTHATTAQTSGGGETWGYFASVTALESNRYLDAVSLDNLHNGGNFQRGFARIDWVATTRDTLRFNLMSGRSSFQLANLRSQHAAGQDQRQYLGDFAGAIGWLRTLSPSTALDVTASYRTTVAQLFPSAGDTPVTAAQARHLTTLNTGARVSTVRGRHNLRVGGDWFRFPVSENFSFAVTDPAFAPDIAARSLVFGAKQAGSMAAAFAQDEVSLGPLHLSLGLRHDVYRFLANGQQLQPRVGLAYHVARTGTVFRASYNRLYQTPPNENLLLSASAEAAALAPQSVRDALGGAVATIRPERQNLYEVGVQQSLGGVAALNVAFYHKQGRDQQDNDNFLNTGVIFPVTLAAIRTNAVEARLTVRPVRRVSGWVSVTHARSISTPPFTGGLFLGSTAIDLLSAGPFLIDHDQPLAVHAVAQYQMRRNLWASASVRYDAGLVANPSDPAVVAADPDYADLLPYVNLASNPARVRPRTIADVAVGYDHYRGDRRQWDVQAQVTNVGDATALYNFQSIFVGTRVVQGRTGSVKLRWWW